MYNINELNSMDEAQLRSVAKDMGIKKAESTDRQELVYQVLDQQAIDGAQNEPVTGRRKKSEQKTTKKSDQQSDKKGDQQAENKADSVKKQPTENEAPASETAPKKKRGRPSAAEKAAREAAAAQTPATTT